MGDGRSRVTRGLVYGQPFKAGDVVHLDKKVDERVGNCRVSDGIYSAMIFF